MTLISGRTNEQWLAELQGEEATRQTALEELRERLQRSIYYYLSQERSDLRHIAAGDLQQMSEDLAQDATLRVLDNLAHFRGESQFTTWANKIAVRLAISDLRRARYRDFSLDELSNGGEFLPAEASLVGQAPPNPETAAERDDVRQRLDATLRAALSERQYQALVAVALRGVPMDVVAEQMGTNRNALYKLIHDARRKLREALEAQGLSIDYVLRLFER
ncbi:MAG: sigma-70 family RNA polymerase sigma factor [Anaerolineae bacterium]|jgi:RNA polymerase sigma-70 factor (ECF subfamily)|nr:sigma-70 family RNA polymerase sigma factor [Anaerolineae bacterium]